jgi:hypothetical protein
VYCKMDPGNSPISHIAVCHWHLLFDPFQQRLLPYTLHKLTFSRHCQHLRNSIIYLMSCTRMEETLQDFQITPHIVSFLCHFSCTQHAEQVSSFLLLCYNQGSSTPHDHPLSNELLPLPFRCQLLVQCCHFPGII